MLPIFVIVILSAIGVLGDTFIKLAGAGSKFMEVKWFAAGLAIYALTAFGWFYVMKHVKLSAIGIYYPLITAFFLMTIGVAFFHEKFNTYEIVAAVLALSSLLVLAKFSY